MSIEGINSITSKLNPNITYSYGKTIDKNDKGKSGTIETINFAGRSLDITLGIAHPAYSNKGKLKSLVYYNIYLVDSNSMKVDKKIGIYEITSDMIYNVYDNRELNISKLGEPLFYPVEFKELFPDISYKLTYNNDDERIDLKKENNDDDNNDDDDDNDDDAETVNDAETDDDAKTDATETDDEETDDEETDDADDDEDEDDEEKVLKPETSDENAQIIEMYSVNDDHNWIQRKFKNPNYAILPGNNDKNLFEAIKQAFDDDTTSVKQIREIVSNTITIDEFLKYRNIYDNLLKEKEELNKKIGENIDSQEKTLPTMEHSEQLEKISNEEKRKKEYSALNKEYNMIKGHLSHYSFMDDVVNLDQLKQVILTNRYWGDNIAISIAERLLYEDRLKIIVLLEDKSREGDMAKIINCNNYNAIELNNQQIVRPKNYIILSLSGKNYSVVTYKNKKMLKFDEVPYGIKRRITDNCTNVI